VPEALITRVLDAAIRAPSAGNAQNWHFVVVRDAEQRRRVGALYRKASDIAEAVYKARSRPAHLTEAQWQRMLTNGAHLWDHMGDAPVLLIPCLHQRDLPAREALDAAWRDHYDAERDYLDRIRGASIYPAVQNLILACRALGLGTVITTNHLRIEAEFKALLGIPADVDTFALMPLAGGPLRPGFAPSPLRSGARRPLVRRLARLKFTVRAPFRSVRCARDRVPPGCRWRRRSRSR
jgi:nitroreductase